jgi:hypothetical protein
LGNSPGFPSIPNLAPIQAATAIWTLTKVFLKKGC